MFPWFVEMPPFPDKLAPVPARGGRAIPDVTAIGSLETGRGRADTAALLPAPYFTGTLRPLTAEALLTVCAGTGAIAITGTEGVTTTLLGPVVFPCGIDFWSKKLRRLIGASGWLSLIGTRRGPSLLPSLALEGCGGSTEDSDAADPT